MTIIEPAEGVSTPPFYQDSTITLHHGDCLDVLRSLPDASVDAVVTDPPYGLEFMGKAWDRFDEDSKARAGMSRTGHTDGAERLERPSHMGGLNPRCRSCERWQRGGNPCQCDAPDFPNERRARSAAFGDWCELWAAECLRVLKPGGHMLAFGGTRTWHRLACAIEDSGFEIRDNIADFYDPDPSGVYGPIAWLYGSGFPKSLNVSKAIDKAARGVPQGGSDPTSPNHGKFRTTTTEGKRWDGDSGQSYGAGGSRFLADTASAKTDAPGTGTTPTTLPTSAAAADKDPTPTLDATATEWQGWGTALKPAHEPIVVARKPLSGTVAHNVAAHGTGALNIDACRTGSDSTKRMKRGGANDFPHEDDAWTPRDVEVGSDAGRWPANVVLDESQAAELDAQSGASQSRIGKPRGADAGDGWGMTATGAEYDDQGGASRFFYVAKADQSERVRVDGIAHPTVKPLDIMRWLVRLVTPPGGTVLEPFAGSGTTVEACILEGFQCIAIEREADYLPLIVQRINRRRDPVAAVKATGDDGGLFDLLGEATA